MHMCSSFISVAMIKHLDKRQCMKSVWLIMQVATRYCGKGRELKASRAQSGAERVNAQSWLVVSFSSLPLFSTPSLGNGSATMGWVFFLHQLVIKTISPTG